MWNWCIEKVQPPPWIVLNESVEWWNHIFINFYLYRKNKQKKQTNIISHQIMQSSIALQIKTQYKTNNTYCTINMEPQKNKSIDQYITKNKLLRWHIHTYVHTNTMYYNLLATVLEMDKQTGWYAVLKCFSFYSYS